MYPPVLLLLLFSYLGNVISMDFVCSLIASTNIHALATQWSCTTAGVASTNVCNWSGITCSGTDIVAIILSAGYQLTGKVLDLKMYCF